MIVREDIAHRLPAQHFTLENLPATAWVDVAFPDVRAPFQNGDAAITAGMDNLTDDELLAEAIVDVAFHVLTQLDGKLAGSSWQASSGWSSSMAGQKPPSY